MPDTFAKDIAAFERKTLDKLDQLVSESVTETLDLAEAATPTRSGKLKRSLFVETDEAFGAGPGARRKVAANAKAGQTIRIGWARHFVIPINAGLRRRLGAGLVEAATEGWKQRVDAIAKRIAGR